MKTTIRSKAKKKNIIQEFTNSLKKTATYYKQIERLPSKEFYAKRKELLKIAEDIRRLVKEPPPADEGKKYDIWAKKALQEAIKNLEKLAMEGTLIKTGEFMEYLGWSRQALSKARKALRVFSVEIKGETYFPAFFVDPKYERKNLEAISKALGNLPGTAKLQFMLTPKGSLNSLTPLEALADGNITEVKIAATGFAER